MRVKRNYRKEYDKFQSTEEQKKRRAKRNKDRREAERKGKVKKGDGKDIHHAENGDKIIMPASKNRGISEKSRIKGSKRK
jgi:hypothetical protein|tara:strand:+ start:1774 stop:2013 length:240 start_codon:yes stop_codon:yes gene_type:complete